MPSKEEKESRKAALHALRQKAVLEFEQSLPVSRGLFKELFDFLDLELGRQGCDHSLRLTQSFFQTAGVENFSAVKNWLASRGGYCDCEVLGNVEELFDEGSLNL